MPASGFSAAGQALGFGMTGVADPAAAETEEEKRKRLAATQAAQQKISGNLSAGYGAALSMSRHK